ncbi:MAG: hypothetical protein R2729_16195 [Bryobacteraceae bacterium]
MTPCGSRHRPVPVAFRPPFDTRQFLTRILIPGFRRGAVVKGVDARPETARVLQQKYQQQARQMGSMADIRTGAAVARLELTDSGTRFEERITASTFVVIGRDGAGGGVYTSAAENVFGYRARPENSPATTPSSPPS